jgi:hypothetical protein
MKSKWIFVRNVVDDVLEFPQESLEVLPLGLPLPYVPSDYLVPSEPDVELLGRHSERNFFVL